ncbi:MAG: hypothetical protein M0Z46_09840 [Actinomycetota bacterium]|nr:hypothetical protein [Actinomycetota bacterium]
MTTRRRAPRSPAVGDVARRHLAAVGALVGVAVFAGVASGAAPFTVPSDVAVALPSALFVGAIVMERLRPAAGPWRRMDATLPAGGEGTAAPWLVVIALVVAVELASYFHSGPRAHYPTLSYGMNVVFRYRAAKAAAWFTWLVVGWYLVRR